MPNPSTKVDDNAELSHHEKRKHDGKSTLLQLKNAKRTYRMGSEIVHALDGIDLELYRGEFVTIVGASGSGKSTLLHVLALLDTLSEGQMTLGGQRIDGINDDELSRIRNQSVGIVFQQFNLLADLTVLENIALPLAYQGVPKAEREEIAKEKAERVGLGGRFHHTPRELSGGQAQRVAIARALAVDPEIIMADEPTGALDSQTGKDIMQLFMDLHHEGKTIVMVTHDMKLAEMGSRKVVVSDGKILEDTTTSPAPQASELPSRPSVKGQLRFNDLLHIGLREGLLAHKLRSALTMLGVIIGVASVIAMSSFSEGSKKKQEDQIRALGVNLIKVMDQKLEGESLNKARIQGSLGLTRADAKVLEESVPHVENMALVRNIDMNVIHLGKQLANQPSIMGIEGEYLAVNNLSLEQGRWFITEDLNHLKRVAVIGAGLAKSLNITSLDTPHKLNIGGQYYTIIGQLKSRRVDTKALEVKQMGDPNDAILVPLSTLEYRTRHHRLRSPLDEIQLQLSNEDALFEAGTGIRRLLNGRHMGVNDFDLFIPLDILKAKQESQKLLDVLSLSICAISLLVGGIGIMNIMLASVSERMKEIGIRRAIGARKGDIRRQFLCESILISFAGSIVGLLISFLTVFGICHMLSLPVVFAPILIALAIVLALATGVIFGFFPAKHAAENNVIEVLRNE
jgi:macrolide transport system ATP-binding/permease protein